MTLTTWPSPMTRQYQSPSVTSTPQNQYYKAGNVAGELAENDHTVATNSGISNNILIMLALVVGVLAVGYIVLGAAWLLKRRRSDTERANRLYVRPEMTGRKLVPTVEPKYDAPQ